jgi:hypothetical protein
MSTNMTLITSVTVGSGGAASVTLPATGTIPQTYTDLKIVMSARSTANTGSEGYDATISFNGTTANRSTRVLRGDGSVVSSNAISDPTDFRLLRAMEPNNYTSSVFSNVEIYIPNYTGSNYKSFSVDAVLENNDTATGMSLIAGLWSDTAAITTITLGGFGGNLVEGSTFYLYGISNVTSTTKATGGIVSSDGTYNYHMFPYSGTFTPTQNITADYLVIAGGGAGGKAYYGGGGGAGGLRSTVGATGGGGSLESALSLTANTAYTVTVGAGGAGGSQDYSTAGASGSNSVFSTITSTGGGGGGSFSTAINGTAGGSSGGGGSGTGVAGTRTASPVQGYNGGNASYINNNYNAGGGGGGAGGAGANSPSEQGGAGGIGAQITAFATATQTGINAYYAGGGGGGMGKDAGASGGTPGAGGLGGGGAGSINGSAGSNAIVNTGGGGGGAGGYPQNNGAGGSGLVIIRYAI